MVSPASASLASQGRNASTQLTTVLMSLVRMAAPVRALRTPLFVNVVLVLHPHPLATLKTMSAVLLLVTQQAHWSASILTTSSNAFVERAILANSVKPMWMIVPQILAETVANVVT